MGRKLRKALLGAAAMHWAVATAAGAQTGFPPEPSPPQGAPNVLVIMTDDYRLPFAFTGTLDSVTIDLGPVQPMTGGK